MTDARSEPRHRLALPPEVRLLISETGSARWARALDLAGHGVGLACPHPLIEGTPVTVELPSAADAQVVTAVVRYATPLPAGGWRLGCRLDKALAADAIAAVVAVGNPDA
jgi:hypothetical protein